MSLADLIAPGSGDMCLNFPDEGIATRYSTLWGSGWAMARLRAAYDGRPVAMALTNSHDCAALVVGAVAAGQPLVSMPMPPRGTDLDWYAGLVRRICALSGAPTLLVEPSLLSLMPPMDPVTMRSFDQVLTMRGTADSDPDAFSLTQFTSGSTADPKGVVLTGKHIAANLTALLSWLQPRPGDGACTWLPLSHDMGLIGMFLGSLAGSGDTWAHGGQLVLMTPQGFLRNPASWLAACETFGSTLTAAPNYGYDMAARRRGTVSDLRSLRACIAGGEPVRAGSLERFAASLENTGFDSTAFCPAFGMAEAALAVTGTPTDEHWHAATVDDGYQQVHGVVSSGPALPGYRVRISGGGTGEILVKGPSVASSYADETPVPDADGWFHTRDVGMLRDGELFVLGRTDDVFQVAGRNVFAFDVEAYAGDVEGVRPGRVAAVTENGLLVLIAECEPSHRDQARVSELAAEMSQRIVGRLGVAPHRVLLTPRGALPVTTSGKLRRKALVAAVRSSRLTILAGSLQD
jgi:acyl-CoA synthetase (AMP-forming)/AMP-acid ligase II